ncbi:MAG: leucine-rich repeat domain-containing protein [Acutalibacteraceae bacterium]
MKKVVATLLAALMFLTMLPMAGIAAQAGEWAAAVESAAAVQEDAGESTATSFGAAVKNAVVSISRALQASVTQLGQQSLQQSSVIGAMLTGGGSTAAFAEVAGSTATRAATVGTYGDFQYRVLDDGTAEITGYTGSAAELVIPSVIDGYTVTSIGYSAFYDCSTLVSVTIGNGVKVIGEYAFHACGALESITIPDSVTSIGYSAFSGCSSLTEITIPDSVTSIGSYAFDRCTSLTNVTIPNSVTKIGDEAFCNCDSLKSVTIPNSVTYFGDRTFSNCDSLSSVTIGVQEISSGTFSNCTLLENVVILNGVRSILRGAFDGCYSLTNITIPASVSNVANSAFGSLSTSGLQKFVVDFENLYYSTLDGVLVNKDRTRLIQYPNGRETKNYVIPNCVTSIGEFAFSNCFKLREVTIPDSMTSIDAYAFCGCSGLERVVIPDTVTSIGQQAFEGCDSLIDVTIPDSVTRIEAEAFYNCWSLTSITIPQSVTAISHSAFSGCSKLTNVNLPDGIISIGEYAFSRCTSLQNIAIPHGVTEIKRCAFNSCNSLSSIMFPNSLKKIGEEAFYKCTLLDDIYYTGTLEEWKAIDIASRRNSSLFNATIHYNSYPSDSILSTSKLKADNLSVAVFDKTPFVEGSKSIVLTEKGETNAMLYGVTLTAGGHTETFDKETVLQPSLTGQQATFTCSGFRDYIIPEKVFSAYFASNIGEQQKFYLEKDQEDGKPYLSTVFARKAGVKLGGYTELQSEKLTATPGTQYEVILSANLAGDQQATYYLSQDDAHKISSTTGVFSAVKLTETFVPKKDIYAYVQTGSGTSEPVKLKIELSSFTLPQDTFSLIGKDGQKIKFDKDRPLVGGAEISLDGFKFPLGIEVEGNRFKISFGMDVFSLKSSNGGKWKNDTWESFKKSVSTIQDSVNDATDKLKKYKTFYETFAPGQTYENKAKNFDVRFLGYAEGNVVNGKLVFTEFSGEIATKFVAQATYQSAFWGIPYYNYWKAGASLAAKLNSVRSLPDNNVPFDFGFSLNLTPEFTLGGGAGVKGAISGGLYGKGTIPLKIDFERKHTSGALSGEIGVEGEVMCFKGKKTIFKGKVTIWDKYYGNAKSIPQTYANRLQRLEQEGEGQTDTTLIPRDYLKNTSGWLGGYQPLTRSRSAVADGLSIKELQTSVFKNVQTQLVSLKDGRMMMAWIEDDASRDTYNRLRLVYSIWENGVWSEPKAVDDDGTNDGSPVLATDGETVFVAWQNVKRSLTDADSIDAVLENTEICIAQYDAKAGRFGSKKTLTDNAVYEYSPALAVEAGQAVLYWLSSGANDLTEAGSNTLYRYSSAEGSPTAVRTGMNYILSLACAFVNGVDEVSYSMDQDGDVSTTNDVKAFTLSGGRQTQLTPEEEELETADFAVAYGKLDGKNAVFFADASDIYYSQAGTVQKVFASPRTVNGDLQVLTDGDNTSLVWTEVSDAGTELFTCSYAGSTWSEPVQLSETKALLHDVSMALHNGQIYGVFGRTARTVEDGAYVSGQTDLCYMTLSEFTDLEASFAVIDESQFVKGENATLSVYLKNNGTREIERVRLTLSDTLGTALTVEQEVKLTSGAETMVEIEYPVPQNYGRTALTLTAAVPEVEEFNTANNEDTEELGFADISIGNMKVDDVGNYFILTAVLSNDNQISAEGVKVEVRSGSREGELLDSIEVGTMQPGDRQSVQYIVAKDAVSYDAEKLGQIYFVASLEESGVHTRSVSSSWERITEDNAAGAVLESPELPPPCEDHIYGDYVMEREATCMGQGLAYRVCQICGHKEYQNIEPKGHDYTEWRVVQEPTCTEDGLRVRTCKTCAMEFSEVIPKLGHEADESVWEIVKEPTATEDGLRVLKCKRCGEVLKKEIIPATGEAVKSTLQLTIDGQALEGDVAYVKLSSILTMYKNHSATLGFTLDPSVEIQSVKWSYANWSVSNPEANIESPNSAETVIRPNGRGIGARSTWVTLTVTDVDGNIYQKTVKVRFYKWDWQRK